MTKEGLTYISEYIKKIKKEEPIVRVIRQNCNIKISTEDFSLLNLSEPSDNFLCSLTGTALIGAYEPFLSVVKSMIDKYAFDLSVLFEEADIYRLHRNIYQSYLSTGVIKREENLLLNEIEYEKGKFLTGLVKLLLAIAEDHPFFILINNAGQLCDSTLDVLNILKDETSENLHILLLTSETSNTKGYVADRYNLFIDRLDKLGAVTVHTTSESVDPEADKTFVFQNTTEELTQIENMFQSLAMEQAKYYIELIYQKIEVDKVSCLPDYKFRLLSLYAAISIYTENYSYALILCDKLKEFNAGSVKDNELKRYRYYYYKALADMYIGNDSDAIDAATLCVKQAQEIKQDYLLMQALIIQNMSHVAGWKDVWICKSDIPVSDELVALCLKYNYLNHLAHIFVYSYHNSADIYRTPEHIKDRIPYFTKGIELGRQLGNDKFIFEAYRKGVMMSSSNGFFTTSTYFYMLSIDVVKKTHNHFEEANIYNGLGYDCCTAEEFEKANDYYNKALKIFFVLKSTDYILETLYNMGTNAVLAGDYKNTIDYLTTVTDSFKVLKKDRLRVCNISKLLGLIAVAAFKLGNYSLAHLYYERARHTLTLGHILGRNTEDYQAYLWGDDMFLYHYMSALTATKEGRYEDAMKSFDKAEGFMIARTGSMFINYVLFAVDKADLLYKMSRDDEAVALLNEARAWYFGHGNTLRVHMFDEYISTGKWSAPALRLDIRDITIPQIVNYMKLEGIKNAMVLKDTQLKFLGAFQEVINYDYRSSHEVVSTLLTNFKVNFNLDNILFIGCDDNDARIIFSDLEYTISDDNVMDIVSYFKSNSSGFSLSCFSSNHENYEAFHMIFAKSKISSMVGVPIYSGNRLGSIFITFSKISDNCNALLERDTLDDSDMSVYMIIFRQILGAIEKFKLNDLLRRQAITDELTGLYNRNGYYKLIERYLEDAKAFKKSNDITIMYIDLDNFKYYNDTFGHHLGDEILKKFAYIYVKACKSYGYAIRFGGDEFIILLDTSEEAVINDVVHSIYAQIEAENGFIEFVSRYSNEDIEIPKSHRATCSIGIETGINITDEEGYAVIEKHADAALYYSKKHGKGKAVWYREIV